MSEWSDLVAKELSKAIKKRHQVRQWHNQARPEQIPPDSDWVIWIYHAGRGAGKSKAGANWVIGEALKYPGSTWGVLAPTWKDVKRCFLATPGIVSELEPGDMRPNGMNKSELIATLTNGAQLVGLSAERPDRVRGWNFYGAWADEVGSWTDHDAWYAGLVPAVRLGKAQIVITTTPRQTSLMKDILNREDDNIIKVAGSTWDNAANLSPVALAELERRYKGTRLGRQELEGQLLEDITGALWDLDTIDRYRVTSISNDLVRITVGVDPAVTSGEDADSTGIIVTAKDIDGHAYVVQDATVRGVSPEEWARVVVNCFHYWQADRVIAETNNGGDMVPLVIKMVDNSVPVEKVTATRGKLLRAEPFSIAYANGMVHHVGEFRELEDEMIRWVPDPELRAKGVSKSPDRLDALCWALKGLNLASSSSWHKVYLPETEQVNTRRGWYT